MIRASTLLLILAVGSIARADDPEARKAHFTRGSELATAGDHRGAVGELLAAYTAAPHPNLLYNIAIEYQFLSHSPDDPPEVRLANARTAVGYFRRYLAEATNPPNRAEAEAAILRLEQEQRELRPPVEPPKSEPIARPDVAAPAPSQGAGTARVALSLTGVVLGSMMAIGGAVLCGLGVSENSSANSAPTEGERDDRKATAVNERAAGIALLAVGGAAVLLGAIGLSVPFNKDRPTALRFHMTTGGLTLSGQF